jgi:hypothetical protein
MFRHRFADLMPSEPQPAAVATTTAFGVFVMCPLVLQPATMGECLLRQQLFERAYREAQAVVRPSRLERLQEVALN